MPEYHVEKRTTKTEVFTVLAESEWVISLNMLDNYTADDAWVDTEGISFIEEIKV